MASPGRAHGPAEQAYQASQATAAGTGPDAERKLAQEVNEEYHDPLDDWSSRDVFLSLVPFIVSLAFKDVSLSSALTFGIVYSGFLLIMRTVAYDSRRKTVWPMIDLTTFVLFAIVRGLMRHFTYSITRWWPVILPLTFAFVALLTLLWRRPFTAHYARYPKFDRGGSGVWHGDASYRRTNDIATIVWIVVWSISLLLSLIPILLGHWFGYTALNVIFNYCVPFVLLGTGLVAQQVIGSRYRTSASTTASTGSPAGATYPAGSHPEAPVQYTSAV